MNMQYAISGNQRNIRCFILVCIGFFRGGVHRMRKSECGIRKNVFYIPHSAFHLPNSVKTPWSVGVCRTRLHRAHFWLHAFRVVCTTGSEKCDNFHPGPRFWQNRQIYSANRKILVCGWSHLHFVPYLNFPVSL